MAANWDIDRERANAANGLRMPIEISYSKGLPTNYLEYEGPIMLVGTKSGGDPVNLLFYGIQEGEDIWIAMGFRTLPGDIRVLRNLFYYGETLGQMCADKINELETNTAKSGYIRKVFNMPSLKYKSTKEQRQAITAYCFHQHITGLLPLVQARESINWSDFVPHKPQIYLKYEPLLKLTKAEPSGKRKLDLPDSSDPEKFRLAKIKRILFNPNDRQLRFPPELPDWPEMSDKSSPPSRQLRSTSSRFTPINSMDSGAEISETISVHPGYWSTQAKLHDTPMPDLRRSASKSRDGDDRRAHNRSSSTIKHTESRTHHQKSQGNTVFGLDEIITQKENAIQERDEALAALASTEARLIAANKKVMALGAAGGRAASLPAELVLERKLKDQSLELESLKQKLAKSKGKIDQMKTALNPLFLVADQLSDDDE